MADNNPSKPKKKLKQIGLQYAFFKENERLANWTQDQLAAEAIRKEEREAEKSIT